MFFFGSKRLLEQYESRIADLRAEVEMLRKMVTNATSSTTIPLVALEADAVLSQREETISITSDELAKLQEVESEASRILSGQY